jgi:hypothetical protein
MNELPFSDACERNKEPILGVLQQALPEAGVVLEIGSCTGQHVVYFAAALSGLTWQPSDQIEYLGGLSGRIVQETGANVLSAIELDVTKTWPARRFHAVYSANTAHIMNWDSVCAMFAGTGSVLVPGGPFCLYGPFNEGGRFTSKSNEEFDFSLRARDPGMGVRDLEALESLANDHQMKLKQQFRLPANNSLLVFRKEQE